MSTEGSESITSSQIRRFGLYRTIDAKTEEFLRLSRKRQMRQGCACAAISTTITVTVVVAVILIYEYSMISESTSKNIPIPNWLRLMNTSVNDLPFDVKLDKANIGLDAATIKFLPLILKTLRKNKYFDKTPEETSSQNPLQDKRGSPDENTYDKNVFSDTRNWMRVPTSRFYTIEYKTSPIVYFKSPTRNIDYFKKVRKIRDYQRIMNYVDKMISERVTFGSTVPINKNMYNFNRNSIATDYTTPMTRAVDARVKPQNKLIKKLKPVSLNDKPHCGCSKKINELLTKLINNLQKLLPNFTHTTDKSFLITKSTNNIDSKHNTHSLSQHPEDITLKSRLESSSMTYNFITSNLATTATIEPFQILQHTTTLPKIDYTLNAIIALLKPSIQKKYTKKSNSILFTTTTKNYLEGTDEYYKIENTTETMKNVSAGHPFQPTITIRNYILGNDNKYMTSTISSYPKEYEDDAETTAGYDNIYKTNIDTVAEKTISNTKGERSSKIYYNKSTTINDSNINYKSNGKIKPISIEYNNLDSKIDSLSNLVITEYNKQEPTPKSDDITLEEEIEKISPEDISAEENIKNLENIIKKLNDSDVYNKTTTEEPQLYEWELIKIDDYDRGDIFSKSMIPDNRATYLEIQRRDWKQDEQDFDNNFHNYIFE